MNKIIRCVRDGALQLSILAGAPALMGADIHVPANHATIQGAVNAAFSGDTIRIAPGVYVEQTSIRDKNLTLIGEPGATIWILERP